jgi:hypothetical protein
VNRSHDELREALGALALGQLDDPDLAPELDAHLATCDRCRAELAELREVGEALRLLHPAADEPPVPLTTSAALDRRIEDAFTVERSAGRFEGAARRRGGARWAVGLGGALVGAAAATAIVLATAPAPAPAGPTVLAVPAVESAPGVQAQVGLVNHTWGVELRLRMDGLPGGEAYDVTVVDDAGGSHDAGQFLGVAGTTITCSMNSSLLLRDAARFEVLDRSGAVVIGGAIPDA